MHVFPTRNIHLVQALPDPIHLSACADWPPNAVASAWTDLSTLGATFNLSVTQQGGSDICDSQSIAGGLAVTPFPTGTAGTPGFRFMTLDVRIPQPAPVNALIFNAIVRVGVHEDVTRLFLPYGHVYVFTGREDFVLTVFAEFADGEFWDVTEHPWLEFGSDDTSIAEIDASGRIRGVGAGDTQVWVRPRGRPAAEQRCEVTIETFAQRRGADELVALRLERPATATRTIYLVSDGYVDRERFEEHTRRISNEMFSEANAPFRWVKSRFNVTAIYLRSAGTRGITLGPPIALRTTGDESVMLPRDQITPAGQSMFDPARLNAFGLMYGARMGDVAAEVNVDDSTEALAQQFWLGNVALRSISVDIRRIGPRRDASGIVDPRVAFERRFEELLAELGHTLHRDDRVVFIVDDQLRGGARLSISELEPPDNRFVAMSIGDAGAFDGTVVNPGNPLAMRVARRETFHAAWAATSVIHELGHTFGLGDEYENHRDTVTADDVTRNGLEAYDNLQLLDDVQGGTNVDFIKWAVPRAEKASVVKTVTFSSGSNTGHTIVVEIDGKAEKLWKQHDVVRLRSSFATPRRRDANNNVLLTEPRIRDFGYEVTQVTGSELVLFSPDPLDLNDAAARAERTDLRVLYKPTLNADQTPMLLIEPLVVNHLRLNGAFPKPAGCNVTAATRPNIDSEPVDPPQIQGQTLPTHPADLIGAYQGGNDHACGVIRPAGRCKMRAAAALDAADAYHETWEYCFVCKFIIADRIDPTVLPRVQLHYPKDC